MEGWREYFAYLKQRMVRQKETGHGDLKTELNRCLSTLQLVFIGVGNTVGVGIYVLLGVIAKDYAGPSAVLCFVIAIVVTLMNALVFSEFSSSTTQTGASYIFVYKVGGEFLAFLCGWVMIIGSLASACVGARAWSGLLDSFFNHSIQNYTTSVLGEIQFGRPFANSLDLTAFSFQAILTIIVSCNVRCSSILNSVLSLLTVSVLVFVAIAGPVVGDVDNFLNTDHGGFFPFGLFGVVKGSSMAIYACSGFDIVSMSAEEAKDPQKSVPRAIILGLLIVAVVYIGATIGILFLIPYSLINIIAPLPGAFGYRGMAWGKFFVTLGPLFSFSNLQMLNLYSLSRMMYRMASDGLFFQFFLKVNKKTGVPVNSVIVVGTFTSLFSLMFDLSFLVEMTILLMLIIFIFLGSALIKLKVSKLESSSSAHFNVKNNLERIIPSSVGCEESAVNTSSNDLVARSAPMNDFSTVNNQGKVDEDLASNSFLFKDGTNDKSALLEMDNTLHESNSEGEDDVLFRKECNSKNNICIKDIQSDKAAQEPLCLRLRLAKKCSVFVPGVLSLNQVIFLHWLCCIGFSIQVNYGWRDIMNASVVALLAISLLVCMLCVLTCILWLHKTEDSSSNFQTPLMPLVPTLSIVFSTCLFLSSAKTTGFIEMVVLAVLGSILYCILVCIDMKSSASEEQGTEQSLSLIGHDEEDEEL